MQDELNQCRSDNKTLKTKNSDLNSQLRNKITENIELRSRLSVYAIFPNEELKQAIEHCPNITPEENVKIEHSNKNKEIEHCPNIKLTTNHSNVENANSIKNKVAECKQLSKIEVNNNIVGSIPRENFLDKIPSNNVTLYQSEIRKYLKNEAKIEQLTKCQNSFRDGKFYERVKIDGYDYGASSKDMDNIALMIRNFANQNNKLREMIICK